MIERTPDLDPNYKIGLVLNGIERAVATNAKRRWYGVRPEPFCFAEVPISVLQDWHRDLTIAAPACKDFAPMVIALCAVDDNAVFDEHTHRASVDEWVIAKVRSALGIGHE